ncbi:putative growth arrest-specific protein 8 [Monocercomonoides exilis]|uniref:putative growth arrest-specific protein 8 n=1 Tax=Monocercomonoides exilis TaxID=2049356 RepID=UPI0035597DAC|nr:putative growth arrest-specific protein 8 [Monocercomonoides exilis]|eukprot:MONOS_1252.1-p1 / transcript=MONOS_1252.1 / gene=MONOS_1252 / organism=Monocercomonoides_exilis_PA203 / gene_product=RecName / transcript_product=RecName / location=Mono_scaffold00021:118945-121651(+) / protein_length=593 / sequence_SO=supercontig / SO=protein_coding / is_pseudo=false
MTEAEEKEAQIQKVLQAKKEYEMEQMLKDQYVGERERISTFLTFKKQEVKALQSEIRNQERLAEEKRESYRIMKKEYLQKLNHLLYEYQNELSQKKTEAIVHVARDLDELRTSERETEIERRDAKERFKRVDLDESELFFREKLAHDREISEIRQQHEMEVREMIHKYDEIIRDLRDEMEAQRKKEITALNDAKRQQITKLTEKHLEEFHRIKAYYNETTHQEHFTLIEQLKGQVSEKKKIEAAQRKMLSQTAAESKKEEEPLRQAVEESERLRQRLKTWDEQKMQLDEAKSKELTLKARLEQLSWEHEVLTQRCAQEERDRDELQEAFEKEAYSIQQSALLHGMLMEKKMAKLNEMMERRDAQLSELLLLADPDGDGMIGGVDQREARDTAVDVIKQKNQEIHRLEDDLEKLTKAHRETIRFYEDILKQYEIPFEELGFLPLVTSLEVPPSHDEEELEEIENIDQSIIRNKRSGRTGRMGQEEEVPPYSATHPISKTGNEERRQQMGQPSSSSASSSSSSSTIPSSPSSPSSSSSSTSSSLSSARKPSSPASTTPRRIASTKVTARSPIAKTTAKKAVTPKAVAKPKSATTK